jgi:signal transduction histidine kinase
MGFEKSCIQNANLISQMSHDVNSMISLIKSNVPEIEKSVTDKMNYTEQMTKDILQYVREIETLDSEVEIVELMDSIIETIPVPKNIELSKKYKVDSNSIKVDVELINRALVEIIKNSITAIEHETGKITIEVGIKIFKNIFIKNKFFVVKIEDNGNGINADFLDLVKNPFFTTRKSEYHSGLGLTIANKIIEAHGGQMRIENNNGNNTVVTIYLPIQEKENE